MSERVMNELSSQKQAVLSCRNLGKRYEQGPESVEVLSGLQLELFPGQRVAIVGSSGSGKSTLLNLLGGLDTPSEGSVWLAGEELSALNEKDRGLLRNRALGFVYQFHHLLAEFTALENVMLPVMLGGASAEAAGKRASALLEQVGLDPSMGKRYPHQFSGVQRQRIAIARAMIIEPDLVVLDEAVSALDVTVQAQILRLLDELQRELELTYIFISHDLAVVNQISDTVSVLSHGTQVESGPTAQVFAHPETEYTRQLIDAIPGSRYRAGDLNLGL